MEALASCPASMPIAVAQKGGAFFALGLECRAHATLEGEKVLVYGAGKNQRKISGAIEGALSGLGFKRGVKVKLDSQVPQGAGLGELEAAQVAASFAASAAAAKTRGGVCELKVDKYMTEQFLLAGEKVAGRAELLGFCAKEGGEFGRLAASVYGGFVVAKNAKILRRGGMETLSARLTLPKKPPKNTTRLFESERELALDEALRGNLYTAMRLHALIDGERKTVEKEMRDKAIAVAASKEGAVAGLFRGRKPAGCVSVPNTGARIVGKPLRILKTAEFLKLKGDQEFTLL